ncbi:MAG: alpha-L-fucosidase, partial [Ginsengibacter sp.]
MKKNLAVILILLFLNTTTFSQTLPVPAKRQLQWQPMETNAFLHFTVNTFTDKEWGDGTENESVFNPTKFDARQW